MNLTFWFWIIFWPLMGLYLSLAIIAGWLLYRTIKERQAIERETALEMAALNAANEVSEEK